MALTPLYADGSQTYIAYAEEATFGTIPADLTLLRTTGNTLDLAKNTFLSDELKSGRELMELRHGNLAPAGDISCELIHGEWDTLLQGAMGSAWSAAVTTGAVDTIAFVDSNPDTITDTDNGFVDAGFKAGMKITVAVDGGHANDGNYTIATVAAGTLTLVATDSVTALAAGTDTTISASILQQGTSFYSYAFEKGFVDIAEYFQYTGLVVNSFTLNLNPESMITYSFGFLGKGATLAQAPKDAGLSAANTTSPYDTYSANFEEAGTAITHLSSLTLNINNGITPNYALGDDEVIEMSFGRSNVSGSFTAFFKNDTLWDKFNAETESTLQINLLGPDSGDEYAFTIHRIKYTAASEPVSDDGAIIQTFDFQSLYKTDNSSNITISRIA